MSESLVTLKCCGSRPVPQVQEASGLLLPHHSVEPWPPAGGLALILGLAGRGGSPLCRANFQGCAWNPSHQRAGSGSSNNQANTQLKIPLMGFLMELS